MCAGLANALSVCLRSYLVLFLKFIASVIPTIECGALLLAMHGCFQHCIIIWGACLASHAHAEISIPAACPQQRVTGMREYLLAWRFAAAS